MDLVWKESRGKISWTCGRFDTQDFHRIRTERIHEGRSSPMSLPVGSWVQNRASNQGWRRGRSGYHSDVHQHRNRNRKDRHHDEARDVHPDADPAHRRIRRYHVCMKRGRARCAAFLQTTLHEAGWLGSHVRGSRLSRGIAFLEDCALEHSHSCVLVQDRIVLRAAWMLHASGASNTLRAGTATHKL